MLDRPNTIAARVEAWLADFASALMAPDNAALKALFHADSHWRDVMALTWDMVTFSGRDAIAPRLHSGAAQAGLTGVAIDTARTPPREVKRAGQPCIEAILKLETDQGRGSGIVRLTAGSDGGLRAWTFLTALEELKGFEESTGRMRPAGRSYSRDFRGPNWLDLRQQSLRYDDRDPAALIVGGGQAGLAIAARLKHLGVDALIVDREARIGDNWRRRYHALTLHNQVQVNHMPYMPFPASWPTYIPKDKLANWFENYVESLELNFWTGTSFEGAHYDEAAGHWVATLKRSDGTTRTMKPKHIVMATGVSGIPNRPGIASLPNFKGTVLHSSQYEDGDPWRGKNALVIGSGNSGHDIAQDLWSSGAHVTLVQRSPTLVTNIEPTAQLAYALYEEGPNTEDCDLIATATPLALGRASHQMFTRNGKTLDKPLLDGLAARGFKLDYGDDDTGWQYKYLTRGGGYYFNVGCSDLIVKGDVGLAQFDDIAEFTAAGAKLRSGGELPADLIVLATGYRPQEELVTRLFGDDVAARIGPIWGFGDKQELRNMYARTPQPGLWFIAGSLAQCRVNSKYLALQIKALEAGLLA